MIVVKVHVLKCYLTAHIFERLRVRCVSNLRRQIKQREHLFHISQRLLNLAVGKAQNIERAVDLRHDQYNRRNIANGHLAVQHARTGQTHNQDKA